MSKASSHLPIKRDDFLKLSNFQFTSTTANGGEKGGGNQPFNQPAVSTLPSLPMMNDIEDDEVDDGNTGRVQPLNILLLKDIMNKKIQKMSNLPAVLIGSRRIEGSNILAFLQATSVASSSTSAHPTVVTTVGGKNANRSVTSIKSNESNPNITN
jgi:hypothetical protein